MAKQNVGVTNAVAKDGENTSLDLALMEDGTVIIQFGKLIKEVRFSPEQAISLGVGFIQWATRGQAVQRQMSPQPKRQM